MQNSGLIFIPDISGFTEFVTQTEISHSNHIIKELLEEIIDNNSLNFEISEIEGDAVLFYKMGDPPKVEKIIEQAKKIFLAFHTHLKIIERDNICQCGACQTASNLSLKFVTHFGEINEVNVQNFKKLMGSDVILAHRLLKNNIEEKEYLLLTENYLNNFDTDSFGSEEWIEIKDCSNDYENFGEVKSKFISLKKLLSQITESSLKSSNRFRESNYSYSIFIDAPILTVHGVLIDNNSKYKWVPGIKEVTQSTPINRKNSTHTCVFDDLEVHFVTKSNEKMKDEIIYSEQGDPGFGFTIVNDYKLLEKNGGTELTLNLIPGHITKKENFIQRIITRLKMKIALSQTIKGASVSLQNLKVYCESLDI